MWIIKWSSVNRFYRITTFIDEVIVYLSINVNGHNSWCWARKNTQWMEASQVQNVLSFSICGAVGDQLIYVYFDSSVVGEIYLQIL
jgi:membrane-anchored protein YejM (alkaline phosphatase superfamily)